MSLAAAWRAVVDLQATIRRLANVCESHGARALLSDASSRSLRALALQGHAIVSVAHPPRVALATRDDIRQAWPEVAAALPVGSTLFVAALSDLDARSWEIRPIEADGTLGAARGMRP